MRQFEYQSIAAGEFQTALNRIGMKPFGFARIFGPDERRVQLVPNGQEDIPTWAFLVLRVLENAPGAIPEARQTASEIIVRDNANPERGEFPYLEQAGDNDEQD